MTNTQAPESTDTFIIAPAGGEFAVTNRRTGEFIGYFLTRAAADHAAVVAEREITDRVAAEALSEIAHYTCRDIGYGVEEGDVYLPALSHKDWTGKRIFADLTGGMVYLFDDEVPDA